MNVNDSSNIGMEHSIPVAVTGLMTFTLCCILAIVSNSVVIYLYRKHKDLRNKAMVFVFNLCLTDLLTGVVMMVSVFLDVMGIRSKSYSLCLGSREALMYLNNVTKFFIFAATVERYIGICQRGLYTSVVTTTSVRCTVATSWILPLPLHLIVLSGQNHWASVRKCSLPGLIPDWIISVQCTLTFILIIVSVGFYTKILLKARELYRRIDPIRHIALNAMSTQARSIRNGKIVGSLTMVFLLCWLPHDIVTFFYVLGFRDVYELVHIGAVFLGLSNSAINSFLYTWQKRDFRKKLKKWKCRRQNNSNTSENNATVVECITLGNVII